MLDWLEVGLIVVGAIPWIVRQFSARKADKIEAALREAERFERVARTAWNAVEGVATGLGWDGPSKLGAYKQRIEQRLGRELTMAELREAQALAEQWAEDAKREAKRLMDEAFEILLRNANDAQKSFERFGEETRARD